MAGKTGKVVQGDGDVRRPSAPASLRFLSQRGIAIEAGLSRGSVAAVLANFVELRWLGLWRMGQNKDASKWALTWNMLKRPNRPCDGMKRAIRPKGLNQPSTENKGSASLNNCDVFSVDFAHAAFRQRCIGGTGLRIVCAVLLGVEIRPRDISAFLGIDPSAIRRCLNKMAEFQVLLRDTPTERWVMHLENLDTAARIAGTADKAERQRSFYKRERDNYRAKYPLFKRHKKRRRYGKWN